MNQVPEGCPIRRLRLAVAFRHQFRLRTLFLLVAAAGSYLTLFRLAWHWTLLGTGTAAPLVLSLVVTRRWTRLPAEKRTVLRAIVYVLATAAVWVPWVVFVILGPGEAIFKVFEELIPIVRYWNGVWT